MSPTRARRPDAGSPPRRAGAPRPAIVAADIGGTFTDVVLAFSDGRVASTKVPSDPRSPWLSVVEGIVALARLLDEGEVITDVAHATTIASNAILEHAGAPTALVTTRGFRDVIEFRRGNRPNLYDTSWRPAVPLVPAAMRWELDERIGPAGEVITDLDPSSCARVADEIGASGAAAVAICLLHSYANPAHEALMAASIRSRLPDVHVSCSSDLLPEPNEFERTSTTVVNAYLAPIMARYLATLEASLAEQGFVVRLHVGRSDGDLASVAVAMQRPVDLIESGPAAGVIGAAQLAREAGHDNVISFDMGGTTAKACLIEDGRPAWTSSVEVTGEANQAARLLGGSGVPVRTRAIDLAEVGAGGGSIAWVDAAGALRIGPRSAGAVPGPAAYGLGGVEPTVTDAQLVLGYLGSTLAGGTRALDRAAATAAIEGLARVLPGEPTVVDVAYSVFTVASETMRRSLRAVSIAKGRDPRTFTLVAFGGGGPIHACALAETLEMSEVMIPLLPGVFSSLGLLMASAATTRTRPGPGSAHRVDAGRLRSTMQEMLADLRRGADDDRPGPRTIVESGWLGLRYRGQGTPLPIPYDLALPPTEALEQAVADFQREHERRYGHARPKDACEISELRANLATPLGIRTTVPTEVVATETIARSAARSMASHRRAYFGPRHGWLDAELLSRQGMEGRGPRVGPCLFDEADTTVVVPPGWQVETSDRQLRIHRRDPADVGARTADHAGSASSLDRPG